MKNSMKNGIISINTIIRIYLWNLSMHESKVDSIKSMKYGFTAICFLFHEWQFKILTEAENFVKNTFSWNVLYKNLCISRVVIRLKPKDAFFVQHHSYATKWFQKFNTHLVVTDKKFHRISNLNFYFK